MGLLAGKLEPNGTRIMLIWGKVTRDAKITYTKYKLVPKASTVVCTGEKEYINIYSIGKNAVTRTASCLEFGDYVFCAGAYENIKYTDKKGIQKEWQALKCDVIVVQQDITTESPQEKQAVQQIQDDAPPDVFESAGDTINYDFDLTI